MTERIAQPVTLVLAHPDDESASAGGLLQRLESPRLIYLTDGSPRDLFDARRKGFDDWRGYASLRKRELRTALNRLRLHSTPLFYDYPDKQALEHLPALVKRLTTDLAGSEVVLTHPYEHGHPDHDTAAVAVALACDRLGEAAPKRIEFASYHLGENGPAFSAFWEDSEEATIDLSTEESRRKREALQTYESQRETLAQFPLSPERYRQAPQYDFATAAPPGRALYDLYGWEITSDLWRERLGEILA